MALLNVFESSTTTTILDRLEKLKPDTQPQWGKMNSGQMLAHLNVGYGIAFGEVEVKYNFFMKTMLKLFVKKTVNNENPPYKRNGQTAPIFVISDERDFKKEKAKLIDYVKRTEQKGAAFFDGRESPAFGALTSKEWNTQFYKHLDHHFTQFGL